MSLDNGLVLTKQYLFYRFHNVTLALIKSANIVLLKEILHSSCIFQIVSLCFQGPREAYFSSTEEHLKA